jgi:NTE family protein
VKGREDREPLTALVLSGGGALGAYEAGVLRFVMDTMADGRSTREPRFDLFAGTSVGALNCTFLAANAHQPVAGVRELVSFWENIAFGRILRFGPRELAAIISVALGRGPGQSFLRRRLPRPRARSHKPVAGFFDTSGIFDELRSRIPWEQLHRNVERGTIRGIALCAMEVCTGTSVIFYETNERTEYKAGTDRAKVARRVRIGVEHAMASASIPFLFPAVQVDGVCHTDGGLRQNTPLNPVLRMGADRVLVVSLLPDPALSGPIARLGCRRNPYPGMLFMLGKTVRALLESSIDYELHRIAMYNRLLADGQARFGEGFVEGFNEIMGEARNARYRHIETAHIRPSRDLDQLALEALREAPDELAVEGVPREVIRRLLGSTSFVESNLLSYLMFTPTFARALLELGYEDARRSEAQVAALFAA